MGSAVGEVWVLWGSEDGEVMWIRFRAELLFIEDMNSSLNSSEIMSSDIELMKLDAQKHHLIHKKTKTFTSWMGK